MGNSFPQQSLHKWAIFHQLEWGKRLSQNFKGKHCKKLLIEERSLAFIIPTSESKTSLLEILFPKKAVTSKTRQTEIKQENTKVWRKPNPGYCNSVNSQQFQPMHF